ncbi:DUF871 domain-containing protein [Parageobacillus genomosp. 1]|uniref:DUF871 domain-containing protein n=1 Tax=Parageobacillus genomosp. 1 TaxID=1295642 RepID=UPI0021B115B9|nr:DUF871 domain-containing protein [Parageobacillus genomosp. 1]
MKGFRRWRRIDPLCAYMELMRDCGVDKVIVGDVAVTDDDLMRIKEFQDGILPFRYRPLILYDWLSLLETVHTNRRDPVRDVIRSAESRLSLAGKQWHNVFGSIFYRLRPRRLPLEAASLPFR